MVSNKKESGFTVVETLLTIATVAIIGVVGYFVAQHANKQNNKPTAVASTAASAKSQSKPSPSPYAGWQTFKSADGVYSVMYPVDWTGSDCAASNSCRTDNGPLDNWLQPAAHPTWQVVQLEHHASSLSPKAWLYQTKQLSSPGHCLYSSNSTPVNGYQAYFTELYIPPDLSNQCPNSPTSGVSPDSQGSSVGYMDYYVIAHNNQVVMLSMPVQDGSSGTRDTVPLVPVFNSIVKAIKFYN